MEKMKADSVADLVKMAGKLRLARASIVSAPDGLMFPDHQMRTLQQGDR